MIKRSMMKDLVILLLLVGAATALELPPGMQKLLDYQQEIALSITFLIAFIGGLLSFTSPCGFVIIPTFFSYLFKERKRALFMTAIFSLGMIFAFVIFGIIAGILGNFFNIYKDFFAVISGIVLVLFGVMLIFNKGFSLLDFKIRHRPNHGWGVFFLGFFFAIGWTPCIGPILGGMVVLAAGIGSIAKSALLFAFYALGVTLPLLIVSYFSDKYDVAKWFTSRHVEFALFGKKVHTHLYGIIGGILLIIIGIIMFFGKGTGIFMEKIPQYIPWTMDFFTNANEKLVESSFFTSTTANILGIAIALIVLYVMCKSIRHHKEYK